MAETPDLVTFTKDVMRAVWENAASEDMNDIAEIAKRHGVIIERGPTKEEFANPEWWGHQFDIVASDTEGVQEFSLAFRALLAPEEQKP